MNFILCTNDLMEWETNCCQPIYLPSIAYGFQSNIPPTKVRANKDKCGGGLRSPQAISLCPLDFSKRWLNSLWLLKDMSVSLYTVTAYGFAHSTDTLIQNFHFEFDRRLIEIHFHDDSFTVRSFFSLITIKCPTFSVILTFFKTTVSFRTCTRGALVALNKWRG